MKVGLLGHGVVGSGADKIISHGNMPLEVGKVLVRSPEEMEGENFTTSFEDIINDDTIEAVAECMGGIEPAHTFVLRSLKAGKHVVTANKKMLAVNAEELFRTAREENVILRYEASVGGGIPWLCNLTRIRRIEEVDAFYGIMNGTTNWILSAMEECDTSFDELLQQAKKLGYAEQNPTDDIDGHDVRYKTAITIIQSWDKCMNEKEIPTYGIRHISQSDIAYAKKAGYVIKLLGRGIKTKDSISAYVMPVFVKKQNVLAGVRRNYNAVVCKSYTLDETTFIGQGAGSLPTANAVVQDFLDICEGGEVKALTTVHNDLSNIKGTYYVRTVNPAAFADVLAEYVSENAFITKQVSLSDMMECVEKAGDESLFIGEMEND